MSWNNQSFILLQKSTPFTFNYTLQKKFEPIFIID